MTLVVGISVAGCTSQGDLLKNANCEGEVLTSSTDARKIVQLAPDGIDELESEFNESDFGGYRAHCGVRDAAGEERPAIVIDASYLTVRSAPSKVSLGKLASTFPVEGRLVRITSPAPAVGGVSGEGDAALRAPCTLSGAESVPPDMREGTMAVAAWSEDAPDADSLEQRQNAADLALSFLRHAVQKCDDPPKLPESVHVSE